MSMLYAFDIEKQKDIIPIACFTKISSLCKVACVEIKNFIIASFALMMILKQQNNQ